MSKNEVIAFLNQGTQTAKVSTINRNGTCHVVPVWFVLDEDNEDIIFTTGHESVKAKHLRRDNGVTVCVDDQVPPFSFVTMYGTAVVTEEEQQKLLKWTTKIAERYMGKNNAEKYGKRNAVQGELLVRVKSTKIIAKKNIADF
jgi:PPOX class probable F420-dependent enzyme